jgi:hypothetical protein
VACPLCGGPPRSVSSAELALGFRLLSDDDGLDELPQAVAVVMPVPPPGEPQ